MVEKFTKENLNESLIDKIPGSYWVFCKVFGEEKTNQIFNEWDEYNSKLKRIENDYYKNEYPKVMDSIGEFIQENQEFKKQVDEEKRKRLKSRYNQNIKKLDNLFNHRGEIKEKEKLIKESEKIGKVLNSKVDDQMIWKAKQYPINQIIQVNKNLFAVCPFHPDKHPSFYTKNNYGHCFSCGKTADSIDVAMKIWGLNFIEAVLKLNLC